MKTRSPEINDDKLQLMELEIKFQTFIDGLIQQIDILDIENNILNVII